MESANIPPPPAKRPRVAAQGARKVKTGCSVCKTRHKKCDESKPACLQCIRAGWKCDFTQQPPQQDAPPTVIPGLGPILLFHRPGPCTPSFNVDGLHMDYFRLICAPEISLYFEQPVWETLILQTATTEPVIYHAALAIGALGRSRYCPDTDPAKSATRYSLQQYGMAIQALQSRLDASSQSFELAVLASIVFVVVEIHLGLTSKAELHARAACALINSQTGSRLRNYSLLHAAASYLQLQVDSFHEFHRQQEKS